MTLAVRVRAIALLLLSILLAEGVAHAHPTFPYEGIIQAVNWDGSFQVTPTRNGVIVGDTVTVASANNDMRTSVHVGDLVVFDVRPMANGALLAWSVYPQKALQTHPQ